MMVDKIVKLLQFIISDLVRNEASQIWLFVNESLQVLAVTCPAVRETNKSLGDSSFLEILIPSFICP